MADSDTAAALAANFEFSDERVRADRPAVYGELRKGPPRFADGRLEVESTGPREDT
jgi:hypothetical protein